MTPPEAIPPLDAESLRKLVGADCYLNGRYAKVFQVKFVNDHEAVVIIVPMHGRNKTVMLSELKWDR